MSTAQGIPGILNLMISVLLLLRVSTMAISATANGRLLALQSGITHDGVRVGMELTKAVYEQGEPIDLLLVVHNYSHESRWMSLWQVVRDYNVTVTDSSGNSVTMTEVGERKAYPRIVNHYVGYHLQPGQEYMEVCPITEFFNLSRPGKYAIAICRVTSKAMGSGEVAHKLGPVIVTISHVKIGSRPKKHNLPSHASHAVVNGLLPIRHALSGQVQRIGWFPCFKAAVVTDGGFQVIVPAKTDELYLGDAAETMSVRSELMGGKLCLSLDGISRIRWYFSVNKELLKDSTTGDTQDAPDATIH